MTAADLQKFCSKDEKRHVLIQPSSQKDITAATDGRMIVWVPRLADVSEVKNFPVLDSIIAQWTEAGDWRPLPTALPQDTWKDCSVCRGAGEHFCRECELKHECGKCKGEGRIKEVAVVEVGGVLFNSRLIELLATLPSVMLNVSGKPTAPKSVKFDGGKGIIAPIKP